MKSRLSRYRQVHVALASPKPHSACLASYLSRGQPDEVNISDLRHLYDFVSSTAVLIVALQRFSAAYSSLSALRTTPSDVALSISVPLSLSHLCARCRGTQQLFCQYTQTCILGLLRLFCTTFLSDLHPACLHIFCILSTR